MSSARESLGTVTIPALPHVKLDQLKAKAS